MQLKQACYNAFFSVYSFANLDAPCPVFVIGTGRSGTHFLCSCLNKFDGLSDYFGGIESPYMFHKITRLTLENKSLDSAAIGYYKKMASKVRPKIFVDQTHPNIWHVEQLITAFPNAKFLAISRDIYSVAYSMKRHKGVSRWIKNHKKFPKPNKFLGITASNREVYENDLSDLQRAVFRWCSHEDRIKQLATKYPSSVMMISYEGLSEHMRDSMNEIAEFLGVEAPVSMQEFKTESLYKKDNLTEAEVESVQSALNFYMHA